MTAPVVIELAESADISQVAALKQSLQAGLDRGAPITLAAGAVERIDAATLQLLFAFVRDAANGAVDIVWDSPSQAVYDSAKILGMAEQLALPEQA
jgi:anti-anti-sigma regulatory factor